MDPNPYPNLGFDPARGTVGEVQELQAKVKQTAAALHRSHQQIQRLLGESSYWEGDAADQFHDALDGDLPTYMKNAAHSMDKAAHALAHWEDALVAHINSAQALDQEAGEHKAAVHAANQRYEQAQGDPDLKLGGKEYPSQAEADAATDRMRAAENRLKEAAAQLTAAKDKYNDVIRKAKELEQEHEADAKHIAAQLDEADDKLAPQKGVWETIDDAVGYVTKLISDHLGSIGAVAGLLALLPTPFAPVFAGIAIACSAASLVKDVGQAWDHVQNGGSGADVLEDTIAIAGDIAGVVPGVSALGKAGAEVVTVTKATAGASEAASLGASASKVSEFVGKSVGVFSSDAAGAASVPLKEKIPDLAEGAVDVGANVAGEALPDQGAGHSATTVVQGGLAAKGLTGGLPDMATDLAEIGGAIAR